MYRVLVVDDSALMRKLMCDIINSIQGFEVVDVCSDGQSAYRRISEFGSFDVITMNVSLPRMDGLTVMKSLKSDGNTIPIIAISSSVKEDRDMTVKAFDNGAVEFVVRPYHLSAQERESFTVSLKKSLNIAVNSHIEPTIKREVPKEEQKAFEIPRMNKATRGNHSVSGKFDLVAIASSTGGPQALRTCLPMLPSGLHVPVVVVQHMPKGFTASLAERINESANLTVKEAEDKEVLKDDYVYIAPGGKHLEIKTNASGKMICSLSDAPAFNNLKPCADVTFHSIAELPIKNILCVVLTGMGSDGTNGIAELGAKKSIYCITQSEDTCVVYGMPKAADQAGLSDESAPITEISKAIIKKLGV
ncbi:MAG: chemotaxis-specific protein-glutamate methyltransferase CheB [Lachnospiraceae bacterium]|nr:chemotaxis-specific protein-glutamate methyltransferase CheB [Lachnospiraceae bacterium]